MPHSYHDCLTVRLPVQVADKLAQIRPYKRSRWASEHLEVSTVAVARRYSGARRKVTISLPDKLIQRLRQKARGRLSDFIATVLENA